MGQPELRCPILLRLVQVDYARLALGLDEVDDPLPRGLEAQPFRMSAHLPELPREMGDPPVAKVVDGKRLGKGLALDRQKPCRHRCERVAVVSRLIEAGFGQKATLRPLQYDLAAGPGSADHPNLSGEHEEHRLGVIAPAEQAALALNL